MFLTKCILNTYPFPGGSFLKGDDCCSSGIRIPGCIVPYMWPNPVQCHVCKASCKVCMVSTGGLCVVCSPIILRVRQISLSQKMVTLACPAGGGGAGEGQAVALAIWDQPL